MNLGGASHIADFSQSHKTFHDMRTVEDARGVLKSRDSRRRIWVDTPGVSIATDGDISIGVSELESLRLVI